MSPIGFGGAPSTRGGATPAIVNQGKTSPGNYVDYAALKRRIEAAEREHEAKQKRAAHTENKHIQSK
jgi:hypothetical protein